MAMSINRKLNKWAYLPHLMAYENKKSGRKISEMELMNYMGPKGGSIEEALNALYKARNTKSKVKVKPNPVKNIRCSRCGELLIRIYPYADVSMGGAEKTIICSKCNAKRW